MTRLRSALGPIAAAWLLCQVLGSIAAPVVFASTSVENPLECTCLHGDHGICPMHHKPAAPGSTLCLMRGAGDSNAALLSSVFGALGLVPAPAEVFFVPSDQPIVLIDVTTTSLRPAAPDPPPPRA